MADLILDNKIIITPIRQILEVLKKETGYKYFRNIEDKGDNLRVTCAFHKNGQEMHPSADIYCGDSSEVEYGYFHCFTCGTSVSLSQLVEHCFDERPGFGKEWLIERFGDTFFQQELLLPDIELPTNKITSSSGNKFLDESILQQYNYYHDYMWKRGLTKDAVDKFNVGFNPKTQSLTFPVWDHKDNLVMITERSVHTKRFHIQEDVEKPIYLLNFMLKEHKTTLFITEAQIDALTAQGWGYPCVATMGPPSKEQLKILNSCGIRHIVSIFDNDNSGAKFTKKLKDNLKSDILFDEFDWSLFKDKKDINDLKEDQFDSAISNLGLSFIKNKKV